MRFTVYSREGCPYCTKIEEVLGLLKLEHKVYKLGIDFNREEFIAEFGQGSTFPQVILNDTDRLGGCVDTIQYLKENKIV